MLRAGARAIDGTVFDCRNAVRDQALRGLRRTEPGRRLLYELPRLVQWLERHRTGSGARARPDDGPASREQRNRPSLVRVDEYAAATEV